VFTGIVAEIGIISAAPTGRLVISASQVIKGMQLGGSIAVNGVCLTVTNFDSKSFSIDIMTETLKRTNLGQLRVGDKVNLEKPMALGGEMGGHLVQGHIDATGKVISMTQEGGAVVMRFEAPPEVTRYIVPKGFIAVDGISLTVVDRDSASFSVSIVDYTRQHTTFVDKKVGDTVNLEVDIIAKYVEQFNRTQRPGITADFLQEHGFPVSIKEI
jgi:riboflavin synthase